MFNNKIAINLLFKISLVHIIENGVMKMILIQKID